MNLHIPQPCHENWDKMHPTEKGRFCDACQKQVFDFKDASIEQIREEYIRNKGQLCGRMSSRLLVQQYIEAQYKKQYRSRIKQFLIALLLCFGINLFTIDKASAGVMNSLKEQFLNAPKDTAQVVVEGVIRDKENKEQLPFVSVVLMEGDSVIANAITNIDGKYQLKLKRSPTGKLTLKAIYIGYSSLIVENFKITGKPYDLYMESSGVILGGAIIEIEPVQMQSPFNSGKTFTSDEFQRRPK